MYNDESFEPAVRPLCSIAKLDADQCLANSKLLFANAIYESIEVKSSLQRWTATMVELQHNKLYKHYYALMIFLLTLPVTSASCERAHSKVDLVTSAVRASMVSERLEDLTLISSEKTVLDTLNIPVIIDKFAAVPRALHL